MNYSWPLGRMCNISIIQNKVCIYNGRHANVNSCSNYVVIIQYTIHNAKPKFLTGEMKINEALKRHPHYPTSSPPHPTPPFCFSFYSLRDAKALEAVWTIITQMLNEKPQCFLFRSSLNKTLSSKSLAQIFCIYDKYM